MKLVLSILSVLFVVNAQVSVHNPVYCYSSDPLRPQNGMHASQSSYQAILRPNVNPNVSTCTPTRLWFVSRHGGRYPDPVTMQSMIELANGPLQNNAIDNYRAGFTSLCAGDFDLIQNWTQDPRAILSNADLITPSGVETMRQLGQRYSSYFPTLLPSTYNQTLFWFRHSERQRSRESIRAFAQGLFGEAGAENVVFEDVPTEDTLTRPGDFCPAFGLLESTTESDAFRLGPEFRQTIAEVNAKLGFVQQSIPNILTIWDICRFEKTINPEDDSSWCSAFSIANNQVLEYYTDMKYYYRNGYGIPDRRLTENMSCELMTNMLSYLAADTASESARVIGVHSSTLQIFMVALGLFEDEIPLTRHNIAQQINRQWRTSWVSPKGGNLGVVRYDCADGDHDLLFLYNERPLQIPGCQFNGLCKLSFIAQTFQRFVGANCSSLFCTSS